MVRRVVIGVDQAAFPIRDRLLSFAREAGEDVEPIYCGPDSSVSVDYPDFARRTAEMVAGGAAEFGVLICGTGIGMSIAANKVKGIRAALCHDHFTASMARTHNDANVVCAGERTTGIEVIREIIITFLNTPFSGEERHARRVAKIKEIEEDTN